MQPFPSFVKSLFCLFCGPLFATALASPASAQEAPGQAVRIVGPWLAMSEPAVLLAQAERAARRGAGTPYGAMEERPTRKLVAAGVLGAATGIAAGYATSSVLFGNCSGDTCGLGAGIIGLGTAAGTSSLLVPLGVHMANGRQGNYGWSAVASAGIGIAGMTLAAVLLEANTDLAGATMLSIPVLQVVSSIAIERSTARKRRNHN